VKANSNCRSCGMPVPEPGTCREYRGPKDSRGYGLLYNGEQRYNARGHKKGRRQVKLHRWVVAQILGWDAIRGKVVRHHCDNPPCFLYEHLCVGTQQDNIGDMHDRGRASGGSMPGESHPLSKLTEEQARYIRSQRGVRTSIELGRELGVSHAVVRDVWLGRSWRHLL